MFSFKKVKIPSGETQELTAYESWTVRWKRAHKTYGYTGLDTQEIAEVFTNEDDAEKFKEALKQALIVLKDFNDSRNIRITKN